VTGLETKVIVSRPHSWALLMERLCIANGLEMRRVNCSDSAVAGIPSTTLVSSPYEVEMSRLRLEQLRLDEEQLLERKRQHELERIRGPQPKWYVSSLFNMMIRSVD